MSDKLQENDALEVFLETISKVENPENVELKLNKKINKSEVMGLKSQIKHTTEELSKMNAILD
jgi:hypothetical protein